MFQFPGFALKTLCIQVLSTCLCSLLISCANNNKHSGGLPHSEIHGSKLILSSPWLIAEYHVFHRLLLPRHPPNALFALDLIQKKQGFFCGLPFCTDGDLRSKHTKLTHAPAAGSQPDMLRCLSTTRLVYLTWNKIDLLVEPADCTHAHSHLF